MKPQDKPVHMNAQQNDIAPLVIMPGDPLRAKYIANKFLENPTEVTNVRNMLGFTGTYKGTKVTVMGHGMGMPSASIYLFELFHFYNVEKLIRIGTCGVVSKTVDIPEVVLANQMYTESNFALQHSGIEQKISKPSEKLFQTILDTAKEQGSQIHVGAGITTDVFGPYAEIEGILDRIPEGINPLVEEMEGFAIYYMASKFGKESACLYTAVDSKFSSVVLTPEERETSLDKMITLALDAIIK